MAKSLTAFTLIELLAVIIIVCIVAVLLFPMYGMIISRADAARCVSNLKTYIANAGLYIAENNGMLPGTGLIHPAFTVPNNTAWSYQLNAYPEVPSPFRPLCCPSSVKSVKKEGVRQYPAGPGSSTWIWWYGYNTNRFFSDRSGVSGAEKKNNYQNPAHISQITTPSKTPFYMCVDMRVSAGSIDAHGGYMEDGKNRSYYKFWPAHNGFFNVALLDGHIEQVPFAKDGQYGGEAAGDYPQYTWKPY